MPAAPDLLVVYGTLRSGTGYRERLEVDDLVESVGLCTLSGSLFEIDWFPGLVLDGAGTVVAEALRLIDPSALDTFDRWEDFDPARPNQGMYRRLVVRVELDDAVSGQPQSVDAWVYALREPPVGRFRIIGGDWLAHTDGPTSGPR